MRAYYNENDPKAAAWLRMLIQERVIPEGVVDERSIHDVKARELKSFTQCHFFAGIGGWAEALRLANWGDRPVWTGSCPCQPFSAAGKGLGQDDPRHLWPIWFELIRQCRPLVIFGEQVASRAALSWLDLVQDDLESEEYALGAVDLCAAGVGAPHIRQRLYWVAESNGWERLGRPVATGRNDSNWKNAGRQEGNSVPAGSGSAGLVGDTSSEGFQEQRLDGRVSRGQMESPEGQGTERAGAPASFWSACDWLPCIDGKARPVEPGSFPLAHGIRGRVGLLRGYGNAIIPEAAAEFVRAYSYGNG